MEFLKKLNQSQYQAVTTTEGPVMIIAGAGSGKTTVLTNRIAYILASGLASPYQILALTFTNKAAKEMKERIEKIVGPQAKNLWMGTFHSIFGRILRLEAKVLGYTSDFTIYDTEDAQNLVKNIMKELNIDGNLKPAAVYYTISSAKNKLIMAKEFASKYASNNEFTEKVSMVFSIYEKRCKQANAMDFDDLLLQTSILFRDFPDILEKYQKKFKYIMVDEYQDTNFAQYWTTKNLASLHRNVCVVGDDAQSIYAFRGADIQNILNFQKDYSEANIFKLELNYRSTSTVVQAANDVIANNEYQLEKKCYTENEEGEKIKLIECLTDTEEAQKVANYIREQKVRLNYLNKDIAILYRTNAQSRLLEDALRKVGIPYRIYGGLSFYKRKEIKDALAYLKLAVNPYDEEAIRRVINYPKRGIGDSTIEKLAALATYHQIPLFEVIKKIKSLDSGRFANLVDNFGKMILYFHENLSHKDAFEAAKEIIHMSGILKDLKNSDDPEDHVRWENVNELFNATKEFVSRANEGEDTLAFFLQEASLFTDQEEEDENIDKVTLMTVHAAKGLEFTSVIISGLEEGLFPSNMSKNERHLLEEERRLFYVALTRAKKNLALSYAQNRIRFGNHERSEASRFLFEISEAYIDFANSRMTPVHTETNVVEKNKFAGINLVKFQKIKTETARTANKSDFQGSKISEIQVGAKVEHFKFGFGKVLKMEGNGDSAKAVVQFETSGQKTLMLKFANLKVVQ